MCSACMDPKDRDYEEEYDQVFKGVSLKYNFSWKSIDRGLISKYHRESKRAKQHYKNARDEGFSSIHERYMKCNDYAQRLHEQGVDRERMDQWEKWGEPGKPSSKQSRIC